MTTVVETRICTKCFRTLPVTDFHKSRHHNGGYKPACRICCNAVTQARRERLAAEDAPQKPKYRIAIPSWPRAACRDEDPELFFPTGSTGPALLEIQEAKSVCRRCPEMEACLAYALDEGLDAGVWGGMSEDERRALRRRVNRSRSK